MDAMITKNGGRPAKNDTPVGRNQEGRTTPSGNGNAETRKRDSCASMMANLTTMLAPVGRARPRNHHLGLNLGMPEDLLSLLQSNFSPGQFDLSQTDDYFARRKPTITRSIAISVKTMTSIVVCSNIIRNRCMDGTPDHRRVSGGVLAVSLFHTRRSIKLIYCCEFSGSTDHLRR